MSNSLSVIWIPNQVWDDEVQLFQLFIKIHNFFIHLSNMTVNKARVIPNKYRFTKIKRVR